MLKLLSFFLLTSSILASDKLNVLFVAVDDLRPELGCYGNELIKTPNLDAFAADSTVFKNAYCQQAVCAPSRASIMSGCRPDTTKVYDLKTPLRKVMPNVVTLPQFFKENGYDTASLGKIYHHNNEDKNSWTLENWKGPKGDWRNYLNPKYKHVYYPQPAPAWESLDVEDSAYKDGKIVDKACSMLNDFKKSDKNFFLAVGLVKPHLPFNAPKKYWDLYEDNVYQPQTKNWPKDAPKISKMHWYELRAYLDVPKKHWEGGLSAKQHKKLRQGYYACISYVDSLLGKLFNKLKETGLDKNTVVVLWGDHGFKIGDYGSWCKHSNFEIDTRVPLIFKVPGAQGKQSESLAELVDVYPTLAKLCGLNIPKHCEGSDLSAILKTDTKKSKLAAFSQYPRGKDMGHTVRSGKWRYTEWYNSKGEILAKELYDLSKGSLPEENLANKVELKPVTSDLSKLLDKGQGWKKVKADFEE